MILYGRPGWGSALIEAQLVAYGLAHEFVDAGDVLGDPAAAEALRPLNPVAQVPTLVLDDGRVLITSQNHGFAGDPDCLPGHVRVTHVSLFDGSLQGIALTDRPAFGFQGHPEASPGPHDVAYLFDRFVGLMEQAQ